jgi:hypothetical protein
MQVSLAAHGVGSFWVQLPWQLIQWAQQAQALRLICPNMPDLGSVVVEECRKMTMQESYFGNMPRQEYLCHSWQNPLPSVDVIKLFFKLSAV